MVCRKTPPPPARCRRSTLPAVRNGSSGTGRGAGLPPQARGGGLRHVASGKIHRSARHLPRCRAVLLCSCPCCSKSIPVVLQVATTSPRWLSARPELTPRTTTKQMSRWDASHVKAFCYVYINQPLVGAELTTFLSLSAGGRCGVWSQHPHARHQRVVWLPARCAQS